MSAELTARTAEWAPVHRLAERAPAAISAASWTRRDRTARATSSSRWGPAAPGTGLALRWKTVGAGVRAGLVGRALGEAILEASAAGRRTGAWCSPDAARPEAARAPPGSRWQIGPPGPLTLTSKRTRRATAYHGRRLPHARLVGNAARGRAGGGPGSTIGRRRFPKAGRGQNLGAAESPAIWAEGMPSRDPSSRSPVPLGRRGLVSREGTIARDVVRSRRSALPPPPAAGPASAIKERDPVWPKLLSPRWLPSVTSTHGAAAGRWQRRDEGSAGRQGRRTGGDEPTRGLPTPPDSPSPPKPVTITFAAGKKLPAGLWDDVLAAVKVVERQTGKGFAMPRTRCWSPSVPAPSSQCRA